MLAIARPFVEICLLVRPPQDLPTSTFLLGLSVAAHVGLGTVVALLHYPPLTALAVSLTGTLLLAAFAYLLLKARNLLERFTQTLTAFAGTGAVLEAVALPLLILLGGYAAADSPPGAGMVFAAPWLALLVWSWVVSGHILRHALQIRLSAGIGISMAFFWLSALLMHHLFGASAPG